MVDLGVSDHLVSLLVDYPDDHLIVKHSMGVLKNITKVKDNIALINKRRVNAVVTENETFAASVSDIIYDA